MMKDIYCDMKDATAYRKCSSEMFFMLYNIRCVFVDILENDKLISEECQAEV